MQMLRLIAKGWTGEKRLILTGQVAVTRSAGGTEGREATGQKQTEFQMSFLLTRKIAYGRVQSSELTNFEQSKA
jgi:hypothetical protein